MAQSASLQTQDIGKIVKKLEPESLKRPVETRVLRDVTQEGAATFRGMLAGNFPKTAGSVGASWNEEQGRIHADRYPYVFHERGSQYPVAKQLAPGSTGVRSHRRRIGVRNSALRLKPRRYIARTRAAIRRQLPAALEKAAREIEKAWAD